MPSQQISEHGDIHCFYAEIHKWFESHDININALPPLQHSLGVPRLNMFKVEKNRVTQTDIIMLKNEITWINPRTSLGRKMATIRHFLLTLEDQFVIKPSNMDIHLSLML